MSAVDDLSRSLTVLDQDTTLIAVIDITATYCTPRLCA
jgi:hypothetical protein